MSGLLDGAVALVTGGGAGIGRAIAELAAAEGASVVISDIASGGSDVAGRLREQGLQAVHRIADVRDRGQLDALVDCARSEYGMAPTVAFANAGVEGPLTNAWELDDADFLNIIDTNIAGVWRTMAAVLPDMLTRGSGAIVATSSVAGLIGAGGLAAYVASKHAVLGLVKAVALETAKAGIRVNAICPGVIETAMVDRLEAANPAFRETLLAMKPMARMGRTDEVARAAIWLASDAASFTTGHGLTVDGGFVSQ